MPESKDFLMYKNRPLVRNGKTVYYGNMTDKYVIKMEIKSNEILDERVKAIFQEFLKDLETLFQELENRELEIRKELKELKIKDDELEARLQDIKNKKNLNKEK